MREEALAKREYELQQRGQKMQCLQDVNGQTASPVAKGQEEGTSASVANSSVKMDADEVRDRLHEAMAKKRT